MTIKIKGYDITLNDRDNEEINIFFRGMAHLEYNDQAVDIPFKGLHEKGMTGFVEFDLEDPDQIEIEAIEKKAGDIRDRLSEHLLVKGYETGEYDDTITIS